MPLSRFITNFARSSSSTRELELSLVCYLRTHIQPHHRSASPVQKIITTSKGVVIDLDSVSRDAKAQSKELYTWGQSQDADLKDGWSIIISEQRH
jgi:hypothetical protein